VFFRTGAIIRRFAHSIVFVLPVSVAFSPHSVAENATSTSPGTNLPQLLIEQGWQQKTDADGNTIIYLPADKSEAQPAMPDIVQQLRERGWEMRTDTEGNTLLIRVDQNTWSPAKQQPASRLTLKHCYANGDGVWKQTQTALFCLRPQVPPHPAAQKSIRLRFLIRSFGFARR
jgi:hypothetical protein